MTSSSVLSEAAHIMSLLGSMGSLFWLGSGGAQHGAAWVQQSHCGPKGRGRRMEVLGGSGWREAENAWGKGWEEMEEDWEDLGKTWEQEVGLECELKARSEWKCTEGVGALRGKIGGLKDGEEKKSNRLQVNPVVALSILSQLYLITPIHSSSSSGLWWQCVTWAPTAECGINVKVMQRLEKEDSSGGNDRRGHT